ncbi:MFS transporter [Tsukamurella soli]|uniref:MFS transporter n=1 Tax=Tsukamurella soli TaxID=644556 RepID=A0ABP8JE73_9ACTN
MYTMTSVDRSAWGPAATAVSRSLAVPLAAVGIFATCYYLGYVVSNAFGGVLTDWLGGRGVLAISAIVAGALMVAFGSVRSIALGLAVQGVVGLFAGVDYAAGLRLISGWFGGRREGFAMGVFMTATSLGTVIANATVPRIIEAASWRDSYRVFGAVTLALGVVCAVLLRDPPPDAGPDGVAPARRALPRLQPLVRNRDLLLLGLAGFGGLWGTYGFVTWSNTLMIKANRIDPVDAGTVVAIFAFVAVIGKPVIGWATDRFGLGYRVPTLVILVAFGGVLLAFGSLSSLREFLWCAPLLGLVAYAYSPLTAAWIPVLAGRELVGSAAGGVNAVWQLGSVIVPAVVGAVFHATGSFYSAFVVLAVGPFLGAVACAFIRVDRRAERRVAPVPVA